MLLGNDILAGKASNEDMSFILKLICSDGNLNKFRVDEHVDFQSRTIKRGTVTECLEHFNNTVKRRGLTVHAI